MKGIVEFREGKGIVDTENLQCLECKVKDDAPLLLRCVFVVVNGLVTSLYEKNPTILVPRASLASREHTKTLRFRSFTQKFSGN